MGTHHRDSATGSHSWDSPTGTHHGDSAMGSHPGDSPTGTHQGDSPRGLTHRDSTPELTHGDSPTGTHHRDSPTGTHHGDSPRSVLGPASRCLNLSSREASLSLKAEVLRALGSGAPPSATVAACGRDWDLCRGAASLALPAGGWGGSKREVRPQGSAYGQASTGRPCVRRAGSAAARQSRPALTEQW